MEQLPDAGVESVARLPREGVGYARHAHDVGRSSRHPLPYRSQPIALPAVPDCTTDIPPITPAWPTGEGAPEGSGTVMPTQREDKQGEPRPLL